VCLPSERVASNHFEVWCKAAPVGDHRVSHGAFCTCQLHMRRCLLIGMCHNSTMRSLTCLPSFSSCCRGNTSLCSFFLFQPDRTTPSHSKIASVGFHRDAETRSTGWGGTLPLRAQRSDITVDQERALAAVYRLPRGGNRQHVVHLVNAARHWQRGTSLAMRHVTGHAATCERAPNPYFN
jgi:hypothetical protein